jgi:formiminotetrahydrofolate cyclodeaminase
MMSDLRGQRISEFLTALSSGDPTPGGGAAAALAGSLASALGSMVVSVAQAKESTAERASLVAAFATLGSQLLTLAEEDERAFAAVIEALRLPKEDPSRRKHVQEAFERAAAVAVAAATASVTVLRRLLFAEPHASRSIVTDVGVAAHLALTAARSSILMVRANLRSITEAETREQLAETCRSLDAEAEALHADLVSRIERRMLPPRS